MPRTIYKKPQNHTKRNIILGVVVLALVLGAGALAYAKHINKKPSSAVVATTKQPKKLNPTMTNQPNNDRKSSSPQSNTLDSSSATTTPFSVTIVSANVNNGNVHIGTLVNGVTSGNCSLTATQSSKNINLATAKVQADVNNYDCGIFNIPTNNFPASGSWKLILTVTSGSNTATSTAAVQI